MARNIKGTGSRIDGQGSSWIRRPLRWSLAMRDNFRCVYCTRKMPDAPEFWMRHGLDHMNGLFVPNANAPGGLVTCCRACNTAKGSLTARGFATYVAKRRKLSIAQVYALFDAQTAKPLDRLAGRELARTEATKGYARAIKGLRTVKP